MQFTTRNIEEKDFPQLIVLFKEFAEFEKSTELLTIPKKHPNDLSNLTLFSLNSFIKYLRS